MLVLSRKIGEEVVIGDGIRVTLVAIHGKQVRLGITAPATVAIHREELGDTPEPTAARVPSEGEGRDDGAPAGRPQRLPRPPRRPGRIPS